MAAFQIDAFQNDAFQTAAGTSVNAGLASGSGSAYDATASVSSNVSVNAGLAAGVGAAFGPMPSVAPSAGAGTGSGQALDATTDVRFIALADVASGSGAAGAASIRIVPRAGLASGAGSALPPMMVRLATGTGAAYDAHVLAADNYDALPEGDIATGYMPPLAAPIGPSDTTATVTTPSSSVPDVPFVVLVDGEQILVTDVTGTTWTIERGYNGTTATAHGAGVLARPALARVVINGAEATVDVSFQRSRFSTGANGQAGTAEIWIRDLDRTRGFVTGSEVVITFRGIRMWGGYISAVRRQFVFSEGTGNIGNEPRWLILDCVDYNVLFNKRVYWKASDPTNVKVRYWPNGTWDAVVIRDLIDNYLTLDDDGLTYDIQHVGTPALPQISCNPDAPDIFGIGSAGWTWGEVMTAIATQTGAVYYIDPDKTLRYVDDSTKQSRFGWDGLSDQPDNTTTIGYRDVEFTLDGARLINDQLEWGAGQGSDNMVFHRTQDDASIAAHGLWQGAELRYDMYCQETVNRRAETWVYGSPQNRRGAKDDRFFSRVTVREPYFRVADVVTLESTEFGFTQIAPVRNADVTFPTPWDIRCVLTVAHELDAPWSTLEFWIPTLDFDFHLGQLPELRVDWPDPWGPFDPCQIVDCLPVATLGRTPGAADLSMAMQWGTSLPAEALTSTIKTLLIRCRYRNRSGSGSDRTFLEFDLDGFFSSSYVMILPHTGNITCWWNGGNGSTEGAVSLGGVIDFDDWFWVRVECGLSYIKAKAWQDGDAEPSFWAESTNDGTGSEGADNPTASQFWRFVNSWLPSHSTFLWDVSHFEVGPGYTPAEDSFNRTVPVGWGTSDAGVVWEWTFGTGLGMVAKVECTGGVRLGDALGLPPPGLAPDWATACGAVSDGALAQPGTGPVTGGTAGRLVGTGINGGTLFTVDDQYQRGSTEVWVDGRRIRLEFDYVEYPRSAKIEILSHVDIGGADVFDPPKTVIINYVIWTVEDPPPDEEPL